MKVVLAKRRLSDEERTKAQQFLGGMNRLPA
jgi:hypothetical protein